jgi:hypothetical protein
MTKDYFKRAGVNQLKNSTIASNDIPQGLNEGNVDEHIIKISSSVIDSQTSSTFLIV